MYISWLSSAAFISLRLSRSNRNLSHSPSSNIKYIDNQLVTVIKIQMICKCKYKTI